MYGKCLPVILNPKIALLTMYYNHYSFAARRWPAILRKRKVMKFYIEILSHSLIQIQRFKTVNTLMELQHKKV